MRQTPPAIAIFGLLLLGLDFLALSWALSGADRGVFTWAWASVFGLVLLWFIIRKESLWRVAVMLTASALSFFGAPAGLIAFLICRPRREGVLKEVKPTENSDRPFQKLLVSRRLEIDPSSGPRHTDHAKNDSFSK